MRSAWCLRSSRDLGPAWVGLRAGWAEVVSADGTLLYRTPLGLAAARRWLRAHGGRPIGGEPPVVTDWRAIGTAFQLKVWQAARRIPAGQRRTYGQLARAVGCRSAQAVGCALGANPLAGIIPCHRVVSAHGLGGFAWGAARKRAWLEAEVDGAAR